MEDYNPTIPGVRVRLASYADPLKAPMAEAILNPTSLPIDIEVAVGELSPVGSSHTTLQYGHTLSMETSIELYLSSALIGRRLDKEFGTSVRPVDISKYVNWLSSFCYAGEVQRSPSPLLIVWPRVANIVVVVTRFHAEYIRFAADLTPKTARVTLSAKELRVRFKTSGEQMSTGWLGGNSMQYDPQTGNPISIGDHDE